MCERKDDSQARRDKMHRFLSLSDQTLANKVNCCAQIIYSCLVFVFWQQTDIE